MVSSLSIPYFHSEEAAYAHVEARLWPEGPICPHCGCMVRISAITPNPEKRVRMGLKKCGDCKKQFTVKVGTVFEQSHVPLNIWLQAIALICASKKGFSSNQLARTLGVTLRTAWFMSHRIREAMADGSLEPFGGGGGDVEADETYYGHDGRFSKGGGKNMNAVLSLVDRETGHLRSMVLDNVTANAVTKAVGANVDPDTRLLTDSANVYGRIGATLAGHEAVNHSVGEYVRESDPTVHTNTVEGTFSIFKRGMRGIYQHCAQKHLHRYLAEFDFRYSNRIRLGIDDKGRADIALKGIVGKRLTYRTTSARRPGAEARVVW
jgi:transposase-like protein